MTKTPLQTAARAVSIANQADVRTIVNALKCTPVQACEFLEQLEQLGVVSPTNGLDGRTVLIRSPHNLPDDLRGGTR